MTRITFYTGKDNKIICGYYCYLRSDHPEDAYLILVDDATLPDKVVCAVCGMRFVRSTQRAIKEPHHDPVWIPIFGRE